jgi:hypothetical protein
MGDALNGVLRYFRYSAKWLRREPEGEIDTLSYSGPGLTKVHIRTFDGYDRLMILEALNAAYSQGVADTVSGKTWREISG